MKYFYLFLIVLMGNLPSLCAQNFPPIAYWQFEPGLDSVDATGNGFDLNFNTNNLTTTTNGVVGSYFDMPATGNLPFLSTYIDDTIVFDDLSLEFWFKPQKDFFQGRVFYWTDKTDIRISERFLEFRVRTAPNTWLRHTVSLSGTHLADAHTLLDGNWHHIAATFGAKTGQLQVYIDGISYPGFRSILGPSAPLAEGGYFFPGFDALSVRASAYLDEMALYNLELPAELIWQHFNEGLLGQHYNSNLTFAGTLPQPGNNAQIGMDPLEFGPNYPNIAEETWDLLADYPAPRYRPGNKLPRLIPWLADPVNISNTSPGNFTPQKGRNTARTMRLLADEYNYYLHMGNTPYFYGMDPLADSMKIGFHLAEMANEPSAFGLPRFVINNWRQVRPKHVDNTRPIVPYIYNQALPDTYYGRDNANTPFTILGTKRWNWAAAATPGDVRLDSLDYDGRVVRLYLDSLERALTVPHVDMIGENGEALIAFGDLRVSNDPEMGPDATAFPNIPEYEATRSLQFRQRYSDHYLNFQDSVNAAAGRDSVQLYWYNVSGNKPFSHFQYDIGRQISRFSDNRHRGTMYWYPQSPGRWRYGASVLTGMNQIVQGRIQETADGDQNFMPSVSPGLNDNFYRSEDQDMIRPGQFLAVLKGMAMMGADGYALFMYHGVPKSVVYSQGNWRAWQPAIPAYAQGVSSRMEDLIYEGRVLPGDSGILYTGTGLPDPSYYTFSTGNQSDFVVGRKHNQQNRFGIFAALMRTSNSPGHGPRKRDICFQLRDSANVIFDSLLIESRAQGSSYVLDLSGPDTVFYQLDAWHEWTDPWQWCRDFEMEAELFDTATALTGIHTETPSGAVAGDYRTFTAYLRMGGSGQSAEYSFATRHADQDTLRLWIRARSPQSTGVISATLNNGPAFSFPNIGANWQWYSLDANSNPVLFTGLGTTAHQLVLESSTNGLEIDKVLMTRSLNDFTQQAFVPIASAVDSLVCLGDSVAFNIGGNSPDGCIDFTWDFGDGTKGYGAEPSHLYVYADTFTVTLSAWHRCLDSIRLDTLQIVIDAPYVEAGRDTFMCAGDSTQLFGGGDFFFKWVEDDLVSSPIIPNPIVWPDSSGYLHITGTDPQTGCTATDSAYVHVLRQEFRGLDQRVCFGATATLQTEGAYYVWWRPDPRLSSDTVPEPTVIANDTLSFMAYGTDYCRCDTDSVVVTVFPYAPGNPLAAHDDSNIKICEGDTIQLHSSGYTQPSTSWRTEPGLARSFMDNPGITAPTIWPPNRTKTQPDSLSSYRFIINGLDCNAQMQTDTVIVEVFQRPELALWQDTLYHCQGDTVWVNDSVNANTPAIASIAWNTSVDMTDSTILGTGISVRRATNFTLSLGSHYGCPAEYPLTVIPVGIPEDTLFQCQNTLIDVRAFAAVNVQWSPAQYFTNPMAAYTQVSLPGSGYVYATFTGGGCSTTDSLWIEVRSPAEIVGPDTLRACAGDTVPLVVGGVNAALWNPGNLVDDSTSVSTFHIFNLPTTIQVVSCDSFFCPGIDTVLVTWLDAIPRDTLALCLGDTAAISIAGGGTCSWTPNIALSNPSDCNPQFWPQQSRYYYVNHIDSLGCFARDSVWIAVDSVQNNGQLLSGNQTVCLGDSVQLVATGATMFDWSPGITLSDSTISTPLAGPTAPTTYTVSMTNTGACYHVDSLTVSIDSTVPPGTLSISDTLICKDAPITLTAGGGTFYTWTSTTGGNLVSPTNGAVQTAQPSVTSTYYVTVSDGGTCQWRDSVVIQVDQGCCYVPGADYVLRNATSNDLFAQAGCFNPCGNLRLHVIDTFFVNGFMSFSNCELYMDSMAVIWIAPGKTLNLNNTTVQAACPYMWDGIYIADSTAQLNVTGGSISDAAYAAFSLHGGGIEVNNSLFRNNYVSIRIKPFSGVHPATILGSRFTSSFHQMLPPWNQRLSAAGIWIEDVTEIEIGEKSGLHNTFDTLGCGILAFRSNVSVFNNRFENIVPTIVHPKSAFHYGQGCAVYAGGEKGFTPDSVYRLRVGLGPAEKNTFVRNTQGVKVENNIRLECQRNTFLDTGVLGVAIWECHTDTVFVRNNSFENNWFGVRGTYNRWGNLLIQGNSFLGDAQHPGIGVWIDDVTFQGLNDPGQHRIENNYVDLHGIGLGTGGSQGIVVNQNKVHIRGLHPQYRYAVGIMVNSDSAWITQNEVWGHTALTDSVDGIRVNQSPASNVLCNVIHNCNNDLRIWGQSLGSTLRKNVFDGGLRGLVLENNGNIGNQGAPGQPTGNEWIGNGTGPGWNCGNGVTMVQTVNTNAGQYDFFVLNNPTENPDHGNNTSCNGGTGLPILTTSGTPIAFCAPMRTADDDDVEGIKGELEAIASDEKQYSINPYESRYLDEQKAFVIMETDSTRYLGDTLLEPFHLQLKNGNIGHIQQTQESLGASNDSLAMEGNTFSPHNWIELNHKEMTNILAHYDLENDLDVADSITLDGIANQCALQGGQAVYQARTLLGLINPERIFLDRQCGTASNKKSERATKESFTPPRVKVTPNPAHSQISLETEVGLNWTLFNLQGHAVISGKATSGKNLISVGEQTRGVYLLYFLFPQGGSGSVRLVLQ